MTSVTAIDLNDVGDLLPGPTAPIDGAAGNTDDACDSLRGFALWVAGRGRVDEVLSVALAARPGDEFTPGHDSQAFADALADVVIGACVVARKFGNSVDLNAAVAAKLPPTP